MKLLILTLLILLSHNSYSQDIQPGLYISKEKGVILKYSILEVKEDTATIEVYVRWQGVWMNSIRSRKDSINHVTLAKSNSNGYTDENILIYLKKSIIKSKIKKSFTGKEKFTYRKVKEIPAEYLQIRKDARKQN